MAKKKDITYFGQLGNQPNNILKVRIAVWGGILFVVLCGIFFIRYGVHKMYTDNPSLTLRKIQTSNTAHYPYPLIIQMLSEMGVESGLKTLPQLPISIIRDRFYKEPLIKNVSIQLLFPDTMKLIIAERLPIAVLRCNPSYCIDEDGVILPIKKRVNQNPLPTFIGIRSPEKLTPGESTNDANLLAAVNFLKQLSLRKEGMLYDINFIQIDNSYRELRVVLNAREIFKQNATILLPIPGMNAALNGLREIVRERMENHKTVSYIDMTVNKNIPVRK